MPNEVYRAALDGLAALVPPRAARRIVDEALRATSRTPDDVSVAAMRKLLLGPIRKELDGVLPPGAAGPGLKRVAASLEPDGRARRRWWSLGRGAVDPAPAPQAEPARGARAGRERPPAGRGDTSTPPTPALTKAAKAAAVAGPTASVRSTLVRLVEPEEAAAIEAEVAARAAASRSPERPAGAGAGPVTAVPLSRPRQPPRSDQRHAGLPPLDDALVERALRAFGELETVRQVVAVTGDGVVLASGEGVDHDALPALALATARLLGRAGTLRLFALERGSGALFLFPMRDGGLVVLTKPKVNIGAVLAARAALEEAA